MVPSQLHSNVSTSFARLCSHKLQPNDSYWWPWPHLFRVHRWRQSPQRSLAPRDRCFWHDYFKIQNFISSQCGTLQNPRCHQKILQHKVSAFFQIIKFFSLYLVVIITRRLGHPMRWKTCLKVNRKKLPTQQTRPPRSRPFSRILRAQLFQLLDLIWITT